VVVGGAGRKQQQTVGVEPLLCCLGAF